jgi:hypothetical protein
MTLLGTVVNKTIVLDQPSGLAEGTRVEITVKEQASASDKAKPTLLGLLKLAGTISDMPSDFAAEHDHYIHGTPKRNAKGD